MTIFFSAGEPSGDLHAANLIRELQRQRPGIRCTGYGGPQMRAAGCTLHADLTALAVMWLLRALLNLHKFVRLLNRADRYFARERPDAVVLVDYPGFNWWIARRAKRHGIPVFYYAPPQIWAWAGWRVKKMRRFVDHVLASLPFEESWFRERGCRATFVGHPYFDEVRRQELDVDFVAEIQSRPGPLVTILPGSRTQEVTSNLRWFLMAAQSIRQRVPQARFAIAAFRPHQAEYARRLVVQAGLPIEVFVGRTPELIEAAVCCMACSGSVSLELLYHKKPTVILYWITRFAYWVQGFFRKARFITLVNLLAGRELFPEYLTWEDKSEQIAAHVVRWLVDDNRREELVAELAKLKARVARGGASRVGAEYVLAQLDARRRLVPRPHFEAATIVAANDQSTG
jgi:lipid-A-disaccharide synthase